MLKFLRGMKKHLDNPAIKMGLNSIAPGSIDKITEMGNQLEAALRQRGSAPASNAPNPGNDELAKRLQKLGIK